MESTSYCDQPHEEYHINGFGTISMQCPCTISASHNLCVSYYLNLHCASYIDHGRSEDDSPKTVSYQLNTILFTEWKFLLKINKLRLGFLEMQVKTSNMKKNQLF